MTPDADSDRRRLQHVLEAIDSIQTHAPDRSSFEASELVRSHVVLKLQLVGEAANQLRATTRERHQDVPWRKVIDMRHRIVHDYDAINLDIVWTVVANELASLRRAIERVLGDVQQELESNG